eukprot:GFUD01034626.1.p1 GENE.GFUD01034626.1~~GFUD01034626.1.p1  ORF type:complete len:123 (-),score=7.37 GFUD01034626.1:164-532(-)
MKARFPYVILSLIDFNYDDNSCTFNIHLDSTQHSGPLDECYRNIPQDIFFHPCHSSILARAFLYDISLVLPQDSTLHTGQLGQCCTHSQRDICYPPCHSSLLAMGFLLNRHFCFPLSISDPN